MTTPQPLVLPAYPEWLGQWSQVAVGIGTPRQWLAMLPSTVGSELWAITPDGCPESILSVVPNCSDARGNLFYANESTTLVADSTDAIPGTDFFFPSIGSYVFDSVTLNASNSSSSSGTSLVSLNRQTIARFSGTSFWWGMLGLGQKPVALEDPQDHPTVLTSLKEQHAIPSISYGFTAGAYYASSPANLVLGGYDSAAFTPTNVTFDVNDSSGDRALTLSVQSIEVVNTLLGTVTLPGSTRSDISVAIDSMLPALWLPRDVCDGLADALGLHFDEATGFYLVNNTDVLRNLNPQFTFTLAANGTSTETIAIKFQYEAFDRHTGPPTYNESTPYFPLRRAVNDSQSVLGRAFLQEAYVIVDWERGNFTLGQATHRTSANDEESSGIVSILAPGAQIQSTSSTSLSRGAIAGIVVGSVVAALSILGGTAFWFIRKRKRKAQVQEPQSQVDEVGGRAVQPLGELMGHAVHEADAGDDGAKKAGGEEMANTEEKDKAFKPAAAAELESPQRQHELEA